MTRFDSILVRLKDAFSRMVGDRFVGGFDSILVRLKGRVGIWLLCLTPFRFHTGSIKSNKEILMGLGLHTV